MIKDFNQFINEALTLAKNSSGIVDRHYLQRVEDRLLNLDVVGLETKDGDRVSVSTSEMLTITNFFRNTLSQLADPYTGSVFKAADIPANRIGLVRLAISNVILPDGTRVKPIFEVYERTEGDTVKKVQGKYFWIFTIGSDAKTLKLYNVDGQSPQEQMFVIDKSSDHLLKGKERELERLSRLFNIKISDRTDLVKIHKVLLNPANIPPVTLDFTSNLSPSEQLEIFISENKIGPKVALRFGSLDNSDNSLLSIENIPKQMNVTPNKVWVVEWNEKFKEWGALPILRSKQIKGSTGNEIEITLGKKWLHWLDQPIFNPPGSSSERIIKKGSNVSLAKEMANGNWLINIGKVTDIATDSRSSDFPYVKTSGWDRSLVIEADTAKNIFVDFREVRENLHILNFRDWLNS
jgi:hypothetical protein